MLGIDLGGFSGLAMGMKDRYRSFRHARRRGWSPPPSVQRDLAAFLGIAASYMFERSI